MWKAILEWRNATTPGMRSSPAQRLLSRRTRSMLPCKATDYTPQVQMDVQQALIKKKQTTKSYYDRHAKQLPDLAIGQPIRVKCHPQNPNSDWTPGIVTSKAAARSYMVQVDGQQYRRNRIHLRQQATFPDRAPTEPLNICPRQLDTLPNQTPADPQYTPIQTCTSQTHEIQTRRSSRPVQVPARLKDHDLSKGRRTKQKIEEKGEERKEKKKEKRKAHRDLTLITLNFTSFIQKWTHTHLQSMDFYSITHHLELSVNITW